MIFLINLQEKNLYICDIINKKFFIMSSRKKIAILSGAGISKESGINTFRDNGGLWDKYNVEEVCTPEGFNKNPKLVLDFYNMRRRELINVKPNPAHILLAELEKDFDVTIITQNVDDLHERAGSSKIFHMHGELGKVTSSRDPLDKSQIENWELTKDIQIGQKAKDGSQIRPYIVWFGEQLDENILMSSVKAVKEADIFLVVGTSLQVSPASTLTYYTKADALKFAIDPKPILVPKGFTMIKDIASSGVKKFLELIKE